MFAFVGDTATTATNWTPGWRNTGCDTSDEAIRLFGTAGSGLRVQGCRSCLKKKTPRSINRGSPKKVLNPQTV